MTDPTLLTLVTGPFSSLVLLVGMLLGLWKFLQNTVVPSVSKWVDAHLVQVDKLIVEHGKDREAWLSGMQECQAAHERIERKIGGLYGRIDALKESL